MSDIKLYLIVKLSVNFDNWGLLHKWKDKPNYMAKTVKDRRPKSTEPYPKQKTSTRGMTVDPMQAAWKNITDRLQRMERKEENLKA